MSPAGNLVRAMAWDELGNDAPGRSVWTAKGSFVGQRLDYGWKVHFFALKHLSIFKLCSDSVPFIILIILILSNLSQAFTKRPLKNQGARVKTRAATTPTGSCGNSQGTHCQAVGTWSAQSPSWKGGKANKMFGHFDVMDVLRDEL